MFMLFSFTKDHLHMSSRHRNLLFSNVILTASVLSNYIRSFLQGKKIKRHNLLLMLHSALEY